MKSGRLGRVASQIIVCTILLTGCPEPRRASPYRPFHSHLTLVGTGDVCVVTHFTSNMDRYASIASDNHQEYAYFHGYHYSAFRGRISGERFSDPEHPERLYRDGLYWQKIAAVQDRLRARQPGGDGALCRWVMWVDADVIFTNFERPIEHLVAPWETSDVNFRGEPKDVVLPREHSDTIINAGVFLVKNTPGGNHFIDSVADRYEAYKKRKLPEQEAIQDYAFNSDLETPGRCIYERVADKQRDNVAVVPQRQFNSFYQPDTRGGKVYWEKCDFVAHFAALGTAVRVEHMLRVIEEREPCED